MGLQSLRDKLLQAGLVSQEQAKKAEEDARRKPSREARGPDGRGGDGRHGSGGEGRPDRGGRPSHAPEKPKRELTEAEKIAAQEAAAHREHERALNRERDENRKRAAEDRKRQESLRALAEKHELAERGDQPFHFTSRKNKILRIYLTPAMAQQLEAGELAIVEKPLPAEIAFALVPRAAAEAALALDPKAVRFFHRATGESFGFKTEAPAAAEDVQDA